MCVAAVCTHAHRCTVASTHASYCFPVVNNVPVAMLRLLTHSRPINQTIQRAYDHNKYARDECPAAKEKRLKWFPRAESKKDKLCWKNRWDVEAEALPQGHKPWRGESALIGQIIHLALCCQTLSLLPLNISSDTLADPVLSFSVNSLTRRIICWPF